MRKINPIDHTHELAEFVDRISRAEWVAMDTEFLRERTYAPELCLIQIAAVAPDGEHSACVDALTLPDWSPLAALLHNPQVGKIFHSCRQDLEALDTRLDLRVHNLYDTQLAAAFCGYGEQVSYAALVDSLCAVHLPKSHTRADWSQRPLPQAHLQYALDDVKYLPRLRERLDDLLTQKNCLAWHRDECAQALDPAHYQFAPEDAWQRLKGVGSLNAVGQICAQKLACWREQNARKRNLPRGWVLSSPVLLQICREMPHTAQALAEVQAIGKRFLKHNGAEVLQIVQQSKRERENAAAEPLCAPRKLTARQRSRVNKIMQVLAQRAEQTQISRSLFANRQQVEKFVRGATDLPLFKGWRAQVVGEEILSQYS